MKKIIGQHKVFLSEVESTNTYLSDKFSFEKNHNGMLLWVDNQTKGRGQNQNIWISEKSKNLTFSFIVFPSKLEVYKQFSISKFVCVALCEFLSKYHKNVKIKWPNDIYVDDKKIAGILIENSVIGKNIFNSVIGVGMNINQTEFAKNIPNPISLFQITNKEYELEDLLSEICTILNKYYEFLEDGKLELLDLHYHKYMYKINSEMNFKSNNFQFKARIIGVDNLGCLLLKTDNITKAYQHYEIQMIL
jgi:BirA family biotin operon repressor/biotin-[acetyl-CoA-carboxylase] ligase